jgi:hypothetical protein
MTILPAILVGSTSGRAINFVTTLPEAAILVILGTSLIGMAIMVRQKLKLA